MAKNSKEKLRQDGKVDIVLYLTAKEKELIENAAKVNGQTIDEFFEYAVKKQLQQENMENIYTEQYLTNRIFKAKDFTRLMIEIDELIKKDLLNRYEIYGRIEKVLNK